MDVKAIEGWFVEESLSISIDKAGRPVVQFTLSQTPIEGREKVHVMIVRESELLRHGRRLMGIKVKTVKPEEVAV